MNGIDDLRRTLDQHADEVALGDAASRRTAVRYRIGVTRRRRAAAAGGVAAALVVAGGVALLPGDAPDRTAPGPATTVVGVPVPEQVVATGYTYEVVDVVSGRDGVVELTLPPSPETRLVSWATGGSAQDVTVDGGQGDQVLHLDDADFDNWVTVHGGAAATTVVVERAGGGEAGEVGEVGVAVYEPVDEPPAGFSEDGVTARAAVAGGTLVGAALSEPGRGEVTLPVESAGEMVWIHAECAGAPPGARLDVTRDGEGFTFDQRCGEELPLDMSGLSGSGFATRPGESLELQARLTDRDGTLVESGAARIALTVYSQISDDDPAQLIEAAGHTWQLVDVRSADGVAPLAVRAPVGRGMVWVDVDARGRTAADVEFGAGQTSFLAGGSGTGELVDAGQTVRMSAAGDTAGARSERRVAFYVRAD